MTTHELAKKLLEGPDVMAVVSGYEGGLNEINGINIPIKIKLHVHEEWYLGDHEVKTEDDNDDNTAIAIEIEQ